jgi:hypothetical protein
MMRHLQKICCERSLFIHQLVFTRNPPLTGSTMPAASTCSRSISNRWPKAAPSGHRANTPTSASAHLYRSCLPRLAVRCNWKELRLRSTPLANPPKGQPGSQRACPRGRSEATASKTHTSQDEQRRCHNPSLRRAGPSSRNSNARRKSHPNPQRR